MLTQEQNKYLDKFYFGFRLSDELIKKHLTELKHLGLTVDDVIEFNHSFSTPNIDKAFSFIQSKKEPDDYLLYYYQSGIYDIYKPDPEYLRKLVSLFELLPLDGNEKYMNYVLDYDPAWLKGASAHSYIKSYLIKDNRISYTWNTHACQGHMDYSETRFSGLIPYLFTNGYANLYERMLAVIEKVFIKNPKMSVGFIVSTVNFTELNDPKNHERFLRLLKNMSRSHPEFGWENSLYIYEINRDPGHFDESNKPTLYKLTNIEPDAYKAEEIPHRQELKRYRDEIKNGLSEEWLSTHREELSSKGVFDQEIIRYQHSLIFEDIDKALNFLRNNNRCECSLIFKFCSAVGGFYKPDTECLAKTANLLLSLNEYPEARKYLFTTDPTPIYGPAYVNRLHTLIIKDNNLFRENEQDHRKGTVTYAENRFSGLIPYLFFHGNIDLYERVFAIVESLIANNPCFYPIYVCCMNFAKQYDSRRTERLPALLEKGKQEFFFRSWDADFPCLMGIAYPFLKQKYKRKSSIEELID